MKVLAIIPAYNEERNIKLAVSNIKKNYKYFDIVVINDASRDNTYEAARSCGVEVISLPINLGIGSSSDGI
jgi:glycosyltransferase involved in cell wall biosynthesis